MARTKHSFSAILTRGLIFAKDNWILTAFVVIVGVTLLFAFSKLTLTEDEFVYARVKVSQGLWWASTAKPNWWMARSVNVGDVERSLTGAPSVEVVDVGVYPWWNSDQYDMFLTLKIAASKNEGKGTYTFKRSSLGVGAPIDLEFPQSQFSATILDISAEPFEDESVVRDVRVVKSFAYPWEFDAIQVGDTYDDGSGVVLEVLDKSASRARFVSFDQFGRTSGSGEERIELTVDLRLTGDLQDGVFVFGEEQVLVPGRTIRAATDTYYFQDYLITEIRVVE